MTWKSYFGFLNVLSMANFTVFRWNFFVKHKSLNWKEWSSSSIYFFEFSCRLKSAIFEQLTKIILWTKCSVEVFFLHSHLNHISFKFQPNGYENQSTELRNLITLNMTKECIFISLLTYLPLLYYRARSSVPIFNLGVCNE